MYLGNQTQSTGTSWRLTSRHVHPSQGASRPSYGPLRPRRSPCLPRTAGPPASSHTLSRGQGRAGTLERGTGQPKVEVWSEVLGRLPGDEETPTVLWEGIEMSRILTVWWGNTRRLRRNMVSWRPARNTWQDLVSKNKTETPHSLQ